MVCRLVRDDDNPYLAYSPGISIQESSEPFRAFLGAVLSVVKDVPLESSAYNPNIQLDTIEEEQGDQGPLPEDDIDNGSGAYRSSSSKETVTSPMTRSRDRNSRGNTESELLVHTFLGRYRSLGSLIHLQVTSSSPKLPENLQVWIRLYTMSNNVLAIPPCARKDKPRLWLTHFVGFGSTGNVWQCHFDNSDDLFAAKIVELIRHSDAASRQRLHNEFKVYLSLEEAYQSGRLHDRIAPRCYGAFEGHCMDVLILDLCDGILNSWDDLSASERYAAEIMLNNCSYIDDT